MISQGGLLFNSSMIGGSNISSVFSFSGGRAAVAVNAAAYPASPGLCLQKQGPSGGWINISSSFVSDQIYIFDATMGSYRLTNLSTSSAIGVFANIERIPY